MYYTLLCFVIFLSRPLHPARHLPCKIYAPVAALSVTFTMKGTQRLTAGLRAVTIACAIIRNRNLFLKRETNKIKNDCRVVDSLGDSVLNKK